MTKVARQSLWSTAVISIVVIAFGGPWAEKTTPAMSEEALSATFDSAIRKLVISWDPTDPRSADERLKALSAFMYETYDASAWIPQSLFDSNVLTQAVVGDVETIIGENVGLVLWPDNPLVPAFGMAPNAGSDQPLMWTVNCLVCHTAEIDGVAYFGAGTKTFDDLWLGESLKRLTSQRWRGLLLGTPGYDVAAEANRILSSHHHDKIDSMTRGRSTAFSASHVELFMRNNSGQMPSVDDVGRGDVKTPPLWHTAAKMPVERWYSDGSFHGHYPLMASSMELEKDRGFDALVDVVIPRIKDGFESVIRDLRPPPYPYDIDQVLAERGQALFESRELGCASATAYTMGRGTSCGPACMRTWVPILRDSNWSQDSSWRPLSRAHWQARASSTGVAATHRLRSRVSGPTSLTCTTGVFPPSITYWDPCRSVHGSLRSWRHELSIASGSASRCTRTRTMGDSARTSFSIGTGMIATGSTQHARAARTRVMTTGRSYASTRTGGRSSSTSRRCRASHERRIRRVGDRGRCSRPGDVVRARSCRSRRPPRG